VGLYWAPPGALRVRSGGCVALSSEQARDEADNRDEQGFDAGAERGKRSYVGVLGRTALNDEIFNLQLRVHLLHQRVDVFWGIQFLQFLLEGDDALVAGVFAMQAAPIFFGGTREKLKEPERDKGPEDQTSSKDKHGRIFELQGSTSLFVPRQREIPRAGGAQQYGR
jgi:hypothetical protein